MPRLILGDCREVMAGLEACSVDSVVTDPPYGLEFMGMSWDKLSVEDGWRSSSGFSKPGIGERKIGWPSHGSGDSANATCARCGGRMRGAKRCECNVPDWRVKGKPLDPQDARRARALSMQEWHRRWAAEALRVAKPGAHLLAFGGTRLYHRLTCAIEDAGWVIRDCVFWVYGSGFPKSLDIGKAIDKEAGIEFKGQPASGVGFMNPEGRGGYHRTMNKLVKIGDSTPEAVKWDGWGTALKPSVEPIVLAMKPIEGTFAANVLKWGTGGLNIDGCRVTDGTETGEERPEYQANFRNKVFGEGKGGGAWANTEGRWPANLIHDGSAEVVGLFPKAGGGYGTENRSESAGRYGNFSGVTKGKIVGYGDLGSAARFFYCAKASKDDRGDDNTHATVKPTDLMRYLCRLITPPGGIILDPFMGSGSTGVVAETEQFKFIGIEINPEWLEMARARMAEATYFFGQDERSE